MADLSSFSVGGIIQFIIYVLAGGLIYYYRRNDSDRDEAIKQIHSDVKEGTTRLNDLANKFTEVSVEHKGAFPEHKDCVKRIIVLETKVDNYERPKRGGK
jgi:hypothetical protein